MNLDAHTLIWIHVGFTAALGVALLSVAALRPGTRMLRDTGIALLGLGVANACYALRGAIPDVASVVMAHGLLLLSALMLHHTVATFVHRKPAGADLAGWTVVAFALAWTAWFTFVRPDIVARTVVILPAAAFLLGRVAWNFSVFSRSSRGSPVSDVLTGLLWFFCFMTLLTAVLIVSGVNALTELLQPGPAGMTFLATRIIVLSSVVLMIAAIDLKAARGARPAARKNPARAAVAAPVANAGQIASVAARAIARADPKRRPLSVIVVELDNIKQVTAEHGLEASRTLLDWAAQRISWTLRGGDTMERVGLDDFAILMPDTDPQQALGRAEQMRDAIAHGVCKYRELTLSTTASAGVAGFGAGRTSWDELLRAARAGMNRSRTDARERSTAQHPVSGLRYRARV